MSDSPHPFTPVPVRARRDGWTPARQGAFVAALRDTRCVVAAARAVGMSWQTAYRLRARPDAASFAAAWDAALAPPALATDVTGRAVGGVAAVFGRRDNGQFPANLQNPGGNKVRLGITFGELWPVLCRAGHWRQSGCGTSAAAHSPFSHGRALIEPG